MDLQQRVSISRRVTLLSYTTLLAALIIAWVADEPAISNLSLLIIQTVPLLVFLPGILRGNSMVHLYMSCVLLLYIIMVVTNLMLGKNPLFSAIETISSITLFTSTMLYVRYSRQLRQQQASS